MVKHRYLVLSLILFILAGSIGFISYAINSSFNSSGFTGADDYSYPDIDVAEFIDDSQDEPRPAKTQDDQASKSPGTQLSEDALANKLGIESVDEQVYRFMETTPNDPYYPQWYLSNISAPAAWDASTGSSAVTVAVIDSGYALSHEDLVDAWAINSGESGQTQSGDTCWDGSAKDKTTNNCDDDGNGYIDDYRGWDFSNDDSTPQAGQDSSGASHGTKVAGLVGARGNNGIGVAALNWQTKIMPLQGLFDEGYGYTSDIVSAIIYAVDNDADIINLSLGSPFADTAMQAAIEYAYENNVIVVAAAGNCGADPTTSSCAGSPNPGGMLYPGRYEHVISAGATTSSDARASFSSYGPELDFMAPGHGSIQTTTWTSSNETSAYATSSYGTSFASPIIASLVALIKSESPNSSFEEVYAFLDNGIDKVSGMSGQDFTNEFGHGRINADMSLSEVEAKISAINKAGVAQNSSSVEPRISTSSGHTSSTKVGNTKVTTWCIASPGTPCTVTFKKQGANTTATLPTRVTDSQGVAFWNWNKTAIGTGTWNVSASANGKTSQTEVLFID